ncbi:MAG: hypothetical protein ACK4G3_06145 [bacterium]
MIVWILLHGLFWSIITLFALHFPPIFLLFPIFLAFFFPRIRDIYWVLLATFVGLLPDQWFDIFPFYTLVFGIFTFLLVPWVEWVRFSHPATPFFFSGLGAIFWMLADEGMKFIMMGRWIPPNWWQEGVYVWHFLFAGWIFWAYGNITKNLD